jgi:hypothetical protein
MLISLLALAAFTSDPTIYHGRAGTLDVRIPRLDSASVVDGHLNESVWRSAALLTGFSRYAPTDGVAADDSTEVLVWYSPSAIHFGIRAFAAPGTVHATLSDRDRIYGDDYVGIFLSTFNDGRQATVFAANPLGIQGDGIVVESGRGAAAFSGPALGREPTDINPDYVFSSKGRVTDYGYEIEISIPFKTLKYQSADPQTWGINVLRKAQSRGYEYCWAPARRAAASYLAQSGRLVGLTSLHRGLVLDVNPVATMHANGAHGEDSFHRDYERPKLGLNLRWGITNNLGLSATVRPDFAEVESDAGQFVFDPRSALFFAEKRPFFLEGAEQFTVPGNLIYTRRIAQPLVATKLAGKVAGMNVAYLAAIDDTLASATGHDRPIFNVLRLQRDLGTSSRAGLVYTDRIDGDRSNRVGGADMRLVFAKVYSAALQGAFSRTETPDAPTLAGPMWNTVLSRSGRTFGARYTFSGISDEFRTTTGFIGRGSIARVSLQHSLTRFGEKTDFIQTASADVVVDDTWDYRRFVNGDDAIEKKLHFNFNFALRGGWGLGTSLLVEKFGFDDRLYADYAIERHVGTSVDTIAFQPDARIPNRDYLVSFNTPQFKHFSFNAFYLWGRDENFYEWASADIGFLTLGLNWRPTSQLRAEATYNTQYYRRRTDGSTVGYGKIPRLKVEYQLSRSIFLRAVGQYTAQFQDDLRDDTRTGDPLLIRDPDGVYRRALGYSDNVFQGDFLFSYLPTPGTVIYVGYGNTSTEPDALKFRELRRQRDGFFVKLSYLFRV